MLQEKTRLPERFSGAILLVCGLMFTYIFIFSPLIEAINKKPDVSISLEAIIISPVMLTLGFTYTVFGKQASLIFGHLQRPSKLGIAFSIGLAILGLLFYFWVKSFLEGYSYQF